MNPKIINTMINLIHSAKKFGTLTALILALFVTAGIQAQNTTAAIAKQTEVDYGATALTTDGSIRLIDNKGTIKYLQSSNGLTTLTNTSTTDVTTTTFQLGGTLTDDTYIDVDNNEFGLNNITETTLDAATTADDTGTGFTLLVREEGTGNIKKLLLSDFDVTGAQEDFTATDGQTAYVLPGAPELTLFKTYVYRNGAKLVAGTDYTLSATQGTVDLVTTDFNVFAGDVIEIHYIN